MRITSKGQVTIPAAIREQAGLLPGTSVDIIFVDGTVQLVKTDEQPGASYGERVVSQMLGRADGGMTTDEIMAMTRGWGDDDPGFADPGLPDPGLH